MSTYTQHVRRRHLGFERVVLGQRSVRQREQGNRPRNKSLLVVEVNVPACTNLA